MPYLDLTEEELREILSCMEDQPFYDDYEVAMLVIAKLKKALETNDS